MEEKRADHAAALKQAEERERRQTLAERKASYYAMCAGFGMKRAAIDAAWAKYLRDGKT